MHGVGYLSQWAPSRAQVCYRPDTITSKTTMSVNERGSPTASTNEIMLIQETMKLLQLYDGPVDGHAGPKTFRAVRAFKKRCHMRPDNALSADFVAYVREHT